MMPTHVFVAQVVWSACLVACADGAVSLPFGDINVMIVTDVHSWIAGHKHDAKYDANYGDVLSLYQRMKDDCDKNKRDLFFVMNGDFNDGTGLSTDPPVELVPLLEKMPWDVVTTGNHELYRNEFVNYLAKDGGFMEFWGDRYLTANVVNASTGKTLGRTHKFLRGRFGTTVLAFGFLYNMPDHGTAVNVLKVEETVQQQWFLDVINSTEGTFDAILVLGHMDYADALVTVILNAIRRLQPHIPVQFVTGHSHVRRYAALDHAASSFEAGHYLDTVGFASFPRNGSHIEAQSSVTTDFQHVFIDASTDAFRDVLNMHDFATSDGRAFTQAIMDARTSMNLSYRLGCAPRTYQMGADFSQNSSLWKLFLRDVIRGTLFNHNRTKVMMQSTGSLRYDLFEGNVTRDDIVTMSPFADRFWLLGRNVAGSTIASALAQLNVGSSTSVPTFVTTSSNEPFDESATYDLYGLDFDVGTSDRPGELLKTLRSLSNEPVEPTLSYVPKTTTNIWRDFVSSAWPCTTQESVKMMYV